MNRFELVGGDISGRGVDEAGQAVDDRCAGVFDRGGLDDAERGIRLAGNHPVAQVAVLGAVNLADGFLLDGDALHGLDRDDGAHADAAPGFDDLAEGGGADVVVDDAGNMLLRDGLNRQAELVTDGLAGVPRIGRLEGLRVRDLPFKFLRREVAAVRLGQRKAVFIDVVAVSALDLGDPVAAARDEADQIDPENILHAAAGDGAAGLFGQRVEAVDRGGGGRPRIDGLLTGGDDVDPALYAFLHVFADVADEAEQRDDGNVRVTFVEHPVRVVADENAGLYAQLREIAHIHADDGGVDVDGADDLRAVLMQIAQDVLGHLAAAVLNDPDFFHTKIPPSSRR